MPDLELDGFLEGVDEVSSHLSVLCLFDNCFNSLFFQVAENLLFSLSYFSKSTCTF